jgi:aldehyde:ferredoxin oxidoreductase
LRVNLSSKEITTEETPADVLQDYLGARGLGIYLMNKEIKPEADALGPDNKMIFTNGVLAGSMIPGNNKVNLAFKSPLTGTYSWSMAGGHWGPELKFAGYDGIIIEGQSDSPVYLWIDDGDVELRDASVAWGKIIPDAEDAIKEDLGGDENIQMAVIGPAGENLNKMACITAGWYREFGQRRLRSSHGIKESEGNSNRGTQDLEFADTEAMMDLSETLNKALREHPKGKERRMYGTPEMVKGINDRGLWCTRNFSEGLF